MLTDYNDHRGKEFSEMILRLIATNNREFMKIMGLYKNHKMVGYRKITEVKDANGWDIIHHLAYDDNVTILKRVWEENIYQNNLHLTCTDKCGYMARFPFERKCNRLKGMCALADPFFEPSQRQHTNLHMSTRSN